MTFLEITLSNRTMMLLGALATISIVLIIFFVAKRLNKKKN